MGTRASEGSIRRVGGVLAVVAVVGLAAGTASAQAPLPGPSTTGHRAIPTARVDKLSAPTRAAAAAPAAAGRVAIPVGLNPQAVALDSATHTLYEVNGTSATVSVIDTRTCNADRSSGCRRTPPTVSIGAGAGADSIAVDQATDTIYTADPGSDGTGTTVSVIDGSTCNAEDHAGCGQVAHTIQAGIGAVAVDVDQATDTVYVTDLGTNETGTTLSVIDGATCNGRVTTGCGQVPGTFTIGEGPAGVIVDQRTDTVYAGSIAPNGSQTIAVIDGATCNARVRSSCGRPHLVRDGSGSTDFNVGFAIDEQNHTLYATNYTDDAVSMFDTATCRATVTVGCGHHRDARVGSGPTGITVDAPTHSIYVSNIPDDSVSVLDAATCDANTSAGCLGRVQRAVRTGLGPQSVIADPTTDTVYTPNGDANTVSVLNGATCNALRTFGCTVYPPTVDIGSSRGPFGLALNPRTHSLYVVDNGTTAPGTSVSVLNAATCSARDHAGCRQRQPSVAVGQNPIFAVVDTATDTVYVNNDSSDTISVIDGVSCNATHRAGCRTSPAAVKVGHYPFALAIDQATHTLYVTNSASGTVSVINTATCNATDHAGCGQTPRTITVGVNPGGIAVDEATDTVYVSNAGLYNNLGHTMSVIDGATCNATVASGCARAPQTVRTGPGPSGIAIDQATDTVYAADANGFSGPGSVTVINGGLCNATHHGRCGATEHTVRVGLAPFAPAVDQATGLVYVPNYNQATVSVIDGATCDATHHAGCASKPRTIIVGGSPVMALVDPATHTVYVSQQFDGTVSLLPELR